MPYSDPKKRRESQRRYQKAYYEQNPDYYKQRAKARKRETQVWFREFKKTLKCSRCPEAHPACLDFHHPNGTKEHTIARMPMNGYSQSRILAEIKKCKVLCSNCHRKLHAAE